MNFPPHSLYVKVFPCGSAGKESACNVGDLGSILGLGKSPGEGKGYPFQYSGLENPMDWTQLGNFYFHTAVYFFHKVLYRRIQLSQMLLRTR